MQQLQKTRTGEQVNTSYIERLNATFRACLAGLTRRGRRLLKDEEVLEKGMYLVESVRKNRAEGVIFMAPSFCDPALLERPMLQNVLAAHGIPYIAFKYAENSGQMQPIREQAGTFADSIRLWSDA